MKAHKKESNYSLTECPKCGKNSVIYKPLGLCPVCAAEQILWLQYGEIRNKELENKQKQL